MSLNDFFDSLNRMHNLEMELAAVWLNCPVVVDGVRTRRIAPGDLVCVADARLVSGNATHKVIGCFGNITSTILHMTVMDLKSNEMLNLKL